MNKKLNLTVLLSFLVILCNAQLYTRLTSEYNKINAVYAGQGYKSFTIRYYYSTEKNPTLYKDSVSASFKVHDGNYLGNFGDNAVMQNALYLVSIYSTNKSIMVSKPIRKQAGVLNGVSFDSAFLATNVDSAWITDQGSIRSIRFRFTDSSAFKSYTVNYNKSSYQLQKICYVMKQRLIAPGDTINMPDNPCMSIFFTGFSTAAFSDSIFSQAQYVTKDTAGHFIGVGAYSTYDVLASPGAGDTINSTSMIKPWFSKEQKSVSFIKANEERMPEKYAAILPFKYNCRSLFIKRRSLS